MIIEQISEQLRLGDDEKTAELTIKAIEEGISAEDILNKGLLSGMDVIGAKFRDHEIFLPDVLMSAKAMYAGLDILKPLLAKDGIPSKGKVVIGSVKGDLHDIGKNLVGIMLKGAGYEIIDLGSDVAPEKFISAVREHNAQIVGMSALLTTTMPVMKDVVDMLKAEGLADKVRVVVGGAPLSNEYAEEIGASAYCYDAANAVQTVSRLLKG